MVNIYRHEGKLLTDPAAHSQPTLRGNLKMSNQLVTSHWLIYEMKLTSLQIWHAFTLYNYT